VIVPQSRDNESYLVKTQYRKSQPPSTDTWLYHTAETITTTWHRHMTVPHRQSQLT